MLTAQRLRELFSYNKETGLLTRLTKAGGRAIGSVAGSVGKDGRVQIYVDDKNYKSHRIIWLLVTGSWPNYEVDHIDGNPSNNSWSNLRDVQHEINLQNRRRATKSNSTKTAGVTMNRDRFGAQIKINGKRVWLGTYDTPEEAHAVYLKAKREYHIGCTI